MSVEEAKEVLLYEVNVRLCNSELAEAINVILDELNKNAL